MKSSGDNTKSKRGRPPTGTGTLIGVRLQPDQLDKVDDWIDRQPAPKPTRPEALRAGIEALIKMGGLDG